MVLRRLLPWLDVQWQGPGTDQRVVARHVTLMLLCHGTAVLPVALAMQVIDHFSPALSMPVPSCRYAGLAYDAFDFSPGLGLGLVALVGLVCFLLCLPLARSVVKLLFRGTPLPAVAA